jgi:hypothetical protein
MRPGIDRLGYISRFNNRAHIHYYEGRCAIFSVSRCSRA